MNSFRELQRRATRLLLESGYTADGRERKTVCRGQKSFEKMLIPTPSGGQPGWKRRR